MQNPVRRKFLASAIKEMEEKAAIEIVSSPTPGLLQPDFSGSQIREQMETHNRSLGSQLQHTVPNLQDGNPRVYPQVGTKGPVAGWVHESTRPLDPESRRYLRFLHQSVALRSKYRSAGFYQGHGPRSISIHL
jgi:hypothetical protein